jgi:DNA polymerase-3 subunit delta'
VDEVRGLKGFFALASDGGRRVVIVDCADEMNPSAANALLKELEEPPEEHGDVPDLAPALRPVAHHPLPLPHAAIRAAFSSPDLLAALIRPVSPCRATPAPRPSPPSPKDPSGAAVQLVEQDGAALYRDLVS